MLKSVPAWMPKGLAALMGSAFLGFAITASALPVSEYSLILLGDLNANSMHVHNRAFIGGNVTGGSAEFGHNLHKNTRVTSAEIVGNLNASTKIEAGYVAIGGHNTAQNLDCNGTGFNQGACVRQDSLLPNRATELQRQLYDDTLNISRLQSNGQTLIDGNQKTLRYVGSDSIAVFELDGSLLFSQNSNWSLDHGAAETVIINVTGNSIANSGGVNFNNGFQAAANATNIGASNILWNFPEAESIDFGSARFNGSVLAPYADVRMWNDFDGSLAAYSYHGAGQVHDYLFNGVSFPPPPSVAVSEPSMLAMLAGGLGMLGLAFRRRRSGL